jgi:hypothetical protein
VRTFRARSRRFIARLLIAVAVGVSAIFAVASPAWAICATPTSLHGYAVPSTYYECQFRYTEAFWDGRWHLFLVHPVDHAVWETWQDAPNKDYNSYYANLGGTVGDATALPGISIEGGGGASWIGIEVYGTDNQVYCKSYNSPLTGAWWPSQVTWAKGYNCGHSACFCAPAAGGNYSSGTPPQPVDATPSGTWKLALVKTKNTGSGTVEVHQTPNPYQDFDMHATSGFSAGEDGNGSFEMVGNKLVYFKTRYTGKRGRWTKRLVEPEQRDFLGPGCRARSVVGRRGWQRVCHPLELQLGDDHSVTVHTTTPGHPGWATATTFNVVEPRT